MSDPANYLFIDGGYLRKAYEKALNDYFGEAGRIDVRPLQGRAHASKVFYYDCVDERPGIGEHRASEAADMKAWLAQVEAYPNVHVRQGVLRGHGKTPRQKHVDVLIAVDMLIHAVRKNYWHATLVAGDSDFTPLMDALVSLGAHVHLLYDASSIAMDLRDAADVAEKMTLRDYWNWSTPQFRSSRVFPTDEPGIGPRGPRVLRRGRMGLQIVELYEFNGHHEIYAQPAPELDQRLLSCEDLQKLEKYCRAVHGSLEWD